MKPYLQLVRAPNGLTAISNILAAGVIVTAGQPTSALLFLVIASLCFYYGGMTLNDCFDYQEDLNERANRPLPSGQISLNSAWIIGFGLLMTGLILLFIAPNLNRGPLLIGLALCASIIGYNALIKEGFAGSVMMALCRYFNWLLGLSIVTFYGTEMSQDLALLALPILFYICGLTYISKQETSARDRSAMFVLLLLISLSIVSILALFWLTPQYFNGSAIITAAIVITWAGWLLFNFVAVWRDFTPQKIQHLVMTLIIGVIPLDAMMVALAGHYLWACGILVLLPVCRKMSKSLYMT